MKRFAFAGLLTIALAAISLVLPAGGSRRAAADPAPKSPLDFTVKNIDGDSVALSKYKGKVVLIVNTASLCGFTPQYKSLEALYEKYKSDGLVIIGFPANDFGHQEPGTDSSIKQFCTSKYKVSFDMYSKIVVKGDGQAPLYTFLTSKETDPKFSGDIKWNFTKFLVDRKGAVIARFESPQDPMSAQVISAVEDALNDK